MLLCSKCGAGPSLFDTANWDGTEQSSEEESVDVTPSPLWMPGSPCGVEKRPPLRSNECESGSTTTEESVIRGPSCLSRLACSTPASRERDIDWESVSGSEDDSDSLGNVEKELIIESGPKRMPKISEEPRAPAKALGCVRDFQLDGPDVASQLSRTAARRQPKAKGVATQKLLRAAVLGDQLCSTLCEQDVQSIVASMEFFQYSGGEVVVQQGEVGCHFFATHSGELDIIVDGELVNTIGSGRSFGSLALLYNCPRNATVRARAHGAGVWGCDGRAFRQIVRANAQRYYQEHRSFVDSVTLFDGLSAQQKDRLGEAFLTESHQPGVDVVCEGQTERRMYLVKKGKLQVLVGGLAVSDLSGGDCFGERALLYDEPRCATVRTVTACELLCVTYGQLKAALGQDLSPRLLKRNLLLTGLKNSPVFARFSPTQQLALVEKMRFESYSAYAPVDLVDFGIVIDGDVLAPLSRLTNLGAKVLRRGQWFGDVSLVEGPNRQVEEQRRAARGSLVAKLFSNLVDERNEKEGHSVQDLGQLTAGSKGCSLALLTAENLAAALRDLGIAGIEGAGCALDYARRVQALSEVYIFQHLSQRQTSTLVKALMMQQYSKGAYVIREGEQGNTFHVVAKGELGVFVQGKRIHTLSKGGYFGERALLCDEPRAASVQVLSDSADVWSIERSTFKRIVKGRLKEHLMQAVVLHEPQVTLKDLKHIRILGKGSFGVVRLVEHKRTGARYALKRINKTGGVLPPELLYECEMLAELDHPLMVYLVNTMETPKNVYMLTELLNGGDLFGALKKLGWALPAEQARFYAGCMAICLEALHSRGIVYRDLKPQNIMLDSQGYPKLIDFGTAKRLKGCRTFTAIGTPYYIAPEILEGKGYGTEVDMWSFGVVVYEMVCGRYPFGDGVNDVNRVYQEVLKGPLEFPKHAKSRPAKAFIEALLKRKSEERLGSGLRGWEEVREAEFFKSGDSGGHSFFDQIMGRELEPPLVPNLRPGDDAKDPKEAQLSDAGEFAT